MRPNRASHRALAVRRAHDERVLSLPKGALALAAWMGALSGCGAAEIEDSSGHLSGTNPARTSRDRMLDSFEKPSGWVVDGADDPAKLTRSNARSTHGKRSLHVVAKSGKGPTRRGPVGSTTSSRRRGKVSIRWDVPMDLSGVRSVSVDAWAGEEGLKLALAFVTNPDYVYHETGAAKLPVGGQTGWHTLRFRLDGPYMKTAETRWEHTAVLANARRTQRAIFVLYTGAVEECDVFLDRLRYEGRASDVEARVPPRNVEVRATARRARVYGTFELEVSFEAAGGSPFDPRQIRLFADFQAPSGEATRVPGFVTSDGRWLVRYMPTERGRHSFHVGVQNRFGRTTTLPDSFLAERVPVPSPIRVSPRDARQFEYATGEAFYPVGLNVAWASEFRPYFKKFAAAGGNLVRVWLAPWCLPVASREKAGEIDLEAADGLAEVFKEARRHGLRVQLVLAYHGEFIEGWKESPYSAANGGPCAVPAAFFSDPGARRAFKRLLRYVVARFATEPALFAWELFNEADLPPAMSRRDVIAWHREMAGYLKSIDHVGRPVTASTAGVGAYPEIDGLGGIDFLQAHVYRAAIDAGVLDHVKVHARVQKPTFVGEFGGGAHGTTDELDLDGVRLRAGLWLTLASPASGTGLPWWWDTQIEPNDLYRHWVPIAAVARRIDRRGKDFRLVHEALAQVAEPLDSTATGREEDDKAERPEAPAGFAERDARPPAIPDSTTVHGILSRTEGLLYFYDRRVLESFVIPPNVLPEGARLTVQGLVDGEFEIETWEGSRREPSRRLTARSEEGKLVIELPVSLADFAVYFKAVGAPEPGIAR